MGLNLNTRFDITYKPLWQTRLRVKGVGRHASHVQIPECFRNLQSQYNEARPRLPSTLCSRAPKITTTEVAASRSTSSTSSSQ